MADELAAIAGLLDGHGVECVPYKGPTLALRAYGDLAMREFGDLDLLVRARDVLKAKSVLMGRGYVPITPLAPEQEQVLVASSIHYELGLAGGPRAMTVPDQTACFRLDSAESPDEDGALPCRSRWCRHGSR